MADPIPATTPPTNRHHLPLIEPHLAAQEAAND